MIEENVNINMIMALSLNNCIGKNGKIPWYCKEDINFFKEKTTNHIVVMGKNTFIGDLGGKPLKDRINLVLSNSLYLDEDLIKTNSDLFFSSTNQLYSFCDSKTLIENAITLAKYSNKDIFIIGGSKIFKKYESICKFIYINYILDSYNGDTFYYPDYKNLSLISIEKTDNIIYTKYLNNNNS